VKRDLFGQPIVRSLWLLSVSMSINRLYWADFLVDRPTPVEPGDEDSAATWHYSGRVTKSCRSVLLALEAQEDTTAQEVKP